MSFDNRNSTLSPAEYAKAVKEAQSPEEKEQWAAFLKQYPGEPAKASDSAKRLEVLRLYESARIEFLEIATALKTLTRQSLITIAEDDGQCWILGAIHRRLLELKNVLPLAIELPGYEALEAESRNAQGACHE